MDIREANISCGVTTFTLLPVNPEGAFAKFYRDCVFGVFTEDLPCAFVMFSDVVQNRGEGLVAFIREHGLGTLSSPKARKNPNSGNRIKVWIWAPNFKALKKLGVQREWEKWPR